MKLEDFDYELPEALIAQEPLTTRESSRLLTLNYKQKSWKHKACFSEILDYLNKGDVLVLNDTKVINAKILGKKASGGKVDALVVSYENDEAICMIQASKRPKIGDVYTFGNYKAKVCDKKEQGWYLHFEDAVEKVMEELGSPPLPPYIKRKGDLKERFDKQDRMRYQTVYAKTPGAVAAPTAGLHFSQELLTKVKEKGIEVVYVTLHVGPGTFMPIRTENIQEHQMGVETYEVSEDVASIINKALDENRRIIATGTTSCRTLESVGTSGRIVAGKGQTGIYIYPGYDYKIVKALITNFHLPKSTLILLVSALAGKDLIMNVYEDAIAEKYRFYSYGDAMFIYP